VITFVIAGTREEFRAWQRTQRNGAPHALPLTELRQLDGLAPDDVQIIPTGRYWMNALWWTPTVRQLAPHLFSERGAAVRR